MDRIIYLSICIPTFNRADYLDTTLSSIVTQQVFFETEQVEIVISDNNSTDNTTKVVNKYILHYGDKVKYHRNKTNIAEANIEAVLKLGKGLFLKLNNDTLNHKNNSLILILDFVKKNMNNKPELFFSNGLIKRNKELIDLNSFINNISFHSTWIACFGVWKEDIIQINNFNSIVEDKLITRVLFELINKKKMIVFENSNIFKSNSPEDKGGYNFFEVFAGNYIDILHYYYNENNISSKVLFFEKAKLIMKFLIPWALVLHDRNSKYTFISNNGLKIIWDQYKFHPILYLGIFYYLFKKFKKIRIN